MTKPRAKNKTRIIEQIAKDVLGIETLETRNSDSLDFYDLAVWRIAEAMALAYQAGIEKGRSERWEGERP